MARDPYGFPAAAAPAAPTSALARLGVLVGWLTVDCVVGVCSAGFLALAWDTTEDPPFIAFFSSPFWGLALGGTLTAAAAASMRLHPALQLFVSLLAAAVGCAGLPLAGFTAMVIAEL